MKRLIKSLIAVGLIAVLVLRMEWREILPTLARIPPWMLVAALGIMVWELVVSTWRWSVALRIHQLRFEFTYLLRALTNGFFFNNFLPSAIGGDAYRVYRTLPPDGYRSRSLSAVFIDRVSGFAMLLVLGAVGALYLSPHEPIARAYLLFFIAGGVGGAFGLFALQRGWFKFLTSRVRHTALFDALQHNWRHLLDGGVLWAPLIGWSLLFQSTSILLIYWLFILVGHPQPLSHCALMGAASGLAALLPLSINGIGLMEGSLVAMAVALGADYDAAAITAIVRRLLMFTLSLLCGLGYLMEKDRKALPASAS